MDGFDDNPAGVGVVLEPSSFTTVGIDLSLRGTGCVHWDGSTVLRCLNPTTTRADDLPLEAEIDYVTSAILKFLRKCKPDLVSLENQAYGALHKDGRVIEMTGVLKWRLWKRGVLLVTPASTTLKANYAGHGRATKEQVLLAAREVWPGCPNHDLADALAAARWGYDHLSSFIELPSS